MLSFLAKIPGEELNTFVHLMLRGLVPKEKLMTFIGTEKIDQSNYLNENWMSVWHSTLINVVRYHLSNEDYLEIPSDRQIGFLFLLEQMVKILGFNFTEYIPIFNQVVISLITSCLASPTETTESHSSEEDLSDDEREGSNKMKMTSAHASQVRAMCLRRLSGIRNK